MAYNNKTFSAPEQALSDVSKLLSRLCNSRKAAMKLSEITSLTGQVARLTRALVLGSEQEDGKDDGYGDKDHFARISVTGNRSGVIR